MRSRKKILLSAVLVVLALSAAASATASATEWHFGGTTLPEFQEETVVGAAFSSSLKSGGASTTCEHFLYKMEVWNWAECELINRPGVIPMLVLKQPADAGVTVPLTQLALSGAAFI